MTDYYSLPSSHCAYLPCRSPCSGEFCCQKSVQCTKFFAEGQLALDANDHQRPCQASIPTPNPAITWCEKETQTIVDVEEIPSSPSFLQPAAIAIPCVDCDKCCQCCCENNSNSKDRSVRKANPRKKCFSRDVYSQTSDVIVPQISSISQTDLPSTSKFGTQTEKSLCSACNSHSQLKRTANKSMMMSVANLIRLNNDHATALNSVHPRSPLWLNNIASTSLNISPLQMSFRTNDIVFSEWLPEIDKEMESTKKSHQMLVLGERKQKGGLEILNRKIQVKKAMSKGEARRNTFLSSSSDPSCSSSPNPYEGSILARQSSLSFSHLENSSFPPKLCQTITVKRLNPHLAEVHKLVQRLFCPKFLDVLITCACTKTRSQVKKRNYNEESTKRIDDTNSLSFDNEGFVPITNKGNKTISNEPTSDFLKPTKNFKSLSNDCFSQNTNENIENNLRPSLKECFASKSQDNLNCQEILRSFMNRTAVHKKDGRLAGGGDKTIPVDRFPSCHRVMLSGSLSRMNNCPLVSHMRSLYGFLEKPASEGPDDCFVEPVEQWKSDKNSGIEKNIQLPFQNEIDGQAPCGRLKEILAEQNKWQNKGVGGMPQLTGSWEDDLVSRLFQIGRLANEEVTKSGQTDALTSYSPVRKASASYTEIIQTEQKILDESNQLDVDNGSIYETTNERSLILQFDGPSYCCKKPSDLKIHLRSEKCVSEINPNLLPMKESPMSLGFVKERVQLHNIMMNSAFTLSPLQAWFCSHLQDKDIGVSASNRYEYSTHSQPHFPIVSSKHPHSVSSFLPHVQQHFRNCRSSKSLTSIASSKAKLATDSSRVLEAPSSLPPGHNNTLFLSPTMELVHNCPLAEPPSPRNPFKEVISGKTETVMSPKFSTSFHQQFPTQSTVLMNANQTTSSIDEPSCSQNQIPSRCHCSKSLSTGFSQAVNQISPYQNSLGARSNSCTCFLHHGSPHHCSLHHLHLHFISPLDLPTFSCSQFPQTPSGSSQHHLQPMTDDISLHDTPPYNCTTTIVSKNASDSRILITPHEERPATACSTFSTESLMDDPTRFDECFQKVGSRTFITKQTIETNYDEFPKTDINDPALEYQLPEEIHSKLSSGDEMKQSREQVQNAIYQTGNNGKTNEDDMKNYLRSSEENAELNQTDNVCALTISSEKLISRDLSAKANSFTSISPFLSGDAEIHSEQEESKNEAWNNSMRACAEAIVSRIQNASAEDENIRYCYPIRECAKAIISRAHGTAENPILEAYNQRRAKRQHYHLHTLDHMWRRTSPRNKYNASNEESGNKSQECTQSELLVITSLLNYSPMGEVALFPLEHEPSTKRGILHRATRTLFHS